MNSNKLIYEKYKPFRNKLRKLSLEDSLFVIWNYMQNIIFQTNMHESIEIPSYHSSNNEKPSSINPFMLELLANEVILNSEITKFSCNRNTTLRNAETFHSSIRYLIYIEEEVSKYYINKDNILNELSRITFRQFPWNNLSYEDTFIRFYKIFSHEKVNNILKNVVGLEAIDIYYYLALFNAIYLNNVAIKLPISISVINDEKINKFISCFSCDIKALKEKIKEEHNIDDKYLYGDVALRHYPIIQMMYQDATCIVCPIPTLFFWRVTKGLHYQILNHKDYSKAFGESFQSYVGEVLSKALSNTEIKIFNEMKYKVGKNEKSTIDWIISHDDAMVFIECKSKRIKMESKSNLNNTSSLISDIEILSNAIVQTYKTINDFTNNLYPNIKYNSNLSEYPIIILIDEWYVINPNISNKLMQEIEKGFLKYDLNKEMLIDMPYSYTSVEDFETIAQIIKVIGVKKYFETKMKDDVLSKQSFKTYNYNNYLSTIKNWTRKIFSQEYDKLINSFMNMNGS